jgi:hypothetical protein
VQVPCFLLFLCFRKVTQEIFSDWMKQKPEVQIFTGASRTPKERRRGATGGPHHQGAWPGAGPHPPMVSPTRATSHAAPSPIKTPRRVKPKHPITFPEHIAIRRRRRPEDREGPEALPGTLPERGIPTGGLLHRHACLRHDE